MKKYILFTFLVIAPGLMAQVRKIQTEKNDTKGPEEFSVRAQSFYGKQGDIPDQTSWSKVIYRELDLTEATNASLYYPEYPVEGEKNLFRVLIELLAQNSIQAYEYLDGREIFTDRYVLNIKDLMDKFHIPYQEQGSKSGRGKSQFLVDENDIPCNEILSYYIKERWIFDQRGSTFFSQIEAICPVLHRSGDFGGETVRYPMFWIPYEKLRPYLTRHTIMSDGMNNTRRYTFDDYFVLRQYKGEIYKTLNVQNQSLMQQYPHPDSLKVARERIETGLERFEKALWVPAPDEVPQASGKEKKPESGESSVDKSVQPERVIRTTRRTNPRATDTPVRSVRKTR